MATSRKRKDSPDALHGRFAAIAQAHSLSEIARRTDTPLTNVHRYAGGARIPGEFCAALVTRMGVNPGWLLAGEGMPWTSDITAGTSAMAGDLLELVEAMNAVTQMRLGALTGKHHLGVLRQLNDALVRFEELRVRMNAHAEPVFRKLLDDLERALSRMDVDRAGDIARATAQVARLCRQPDLALRHTRLKAHAAYLAGEHEAALTHLQEVFRTSISGGVLATEDDCEQAVRLVMLLAASGRGGEGLRLAEATMLLAGEPGRAWSVYPHLAVVTGNLMVYAGRLYEGLALIKRWFPHVKGEGRIRAAQDALRTGLLCAGLLTPDEAFEFAGHNEYKAITLVLYGVFKEDAAYLERAFDYLEGGRVPRLKAYATMHYILDHGRLVLGALRGGRKYAPPGGAELESKIFETQLLRLTARRAKARKALAQADEMIGAGRELEVMPFVRALHFRNLNELSPADSEGRRRAVDFFNSQVEAGYEIFRT
jgi:hypothetical protein